MATRAANAAPARKDETARLYEKYGRQLFRYCLARLRSPEEAEDAVQSTFIRVHGALDKGVTPRFEAAWLYKIAHNVCLTRSEINGRRLQHEQPTDFGDLELAAPERTERLAGLNEALASMPKNLRDPILLREWQGLSYAEIAASLDTSVSAVETLIFRARRYLVATLRPVLDIGLLYSSVRVLFARLRGVAGAAGPAKIAIGAATIAIGGAGISTGVTIAGDKPPHPHRVPPAQAPILVSAKATFPTRVAQHRTLRRQSTVTVTHTSPPETSTVAVTQPTLSPPASTPATVPPTTAAPPPTPTTTPISTPPTTAPVPTATATASLVTATVPSVTVAIPAPAVPPIEVPPVTTPVLTTPAVTVELPTVTVPTVQTPPLPVTVTLPPLPGP